MNRNIKIGDKIKAIGCPFTSRSHDYIIGNVLAVEKNGYKVMADDSTKSEAIGKVWLVPNWWVCDYAERITVL